MKTGVSAFSLSTASLVTSAPLTSRRQILDASRPGTSASQAGIARSARPTQSVMQACIH